MKEKSLCLEIWQEDTSWDLFEIICLELSIFSSLATKWDCSGISLKLTLLGPQNIVPAYKFSLYRYLHYKTLARKPLDWGLKPLFNNVLKYPLRYVHLFQLLTLLPKETFSCTTCNIGSKFAVLHLPNPSPIERGSDTYKVPFLDQPVLHIGNTSNLVGV